jgi:Fe2+-dicitrate sensor, membrane component
VIPQPVAKTVALQLANGQRLNLSAATDKIVLADARLQNAGKALSYTLKEEENNTALTAMNSLQVPIGKDYRITLSDGTVVGMNAATTLQFPFKFSGSTREICIQGEAYLEVAKDARRPFVVHTQHGTVQVLGTAFNINDYDPAAMKLSLVNGAVCFKTKDKDVALKPGQQVVYDDQQHIRLQAFDEQEVLSWRQGKYYFYDASLQEILEVLPRWYGVQVMIDRPGLGEERFTGMMDRNKPLEAFLQALATTMKINYYVHKDILHLQ